MSARDAAAAVAAAFPADVQPIMVAIAGAESGYDPQNKGDYGLTDRPQASDGSTSWGLWQINSIHGAMLTRLTGSSNPDDWEQWLFVPANNAQAALVVYQSQGLHAWSTYNSGAYLQYMDGAASTVGTTAGTPASMSGAGAPSFFGPLQNITLPKTNFEEVPNSAQYGDVLYGRKYQVIVSDLNGDKALDVSQLHCKFELYKTMLVQPNYSTVTIYNLSPETENAIIQEGYRCVVSGGYVGSQYGMLMDFNVIQPIRYKENGTDFVLQLVGMDSDIFYAYGTANFSLLRGQNARQVIGKVASSCSVPTDIGILSSSLDDTKRLSRGKVVFGLAVDVLRQIAKSEGMAYYMEDGKINFIHPSDPPTDEIIDLTPQTGLIGVPEQQEYGVSIRMLLNPQVKIGSMIHIDNSLVRNQQYSVGEPIYQLDQDGIYRVISLCHRGDTRGQDWYTEVNTVSQTGVLPNMISSGAQNPL